MSRPHAMVLGVGSSHGDDQIGWKVIDELAAQGIEALSLKKLATPIELVDLLDQASEIHIVDAGESLNASVRRLRYCDRQGRALVSRSANRSTHDFGLVQALELAESMGNSTDHITIWLAAGENFEPLAAISKRAMHSVTDCVNDVLAELSSA